MVAVIDTYLVWIDANHYPTFDDFADESDRLGVSMWIQSMGLALAMRDKTVLLAHDEGESVECVACQGVGYRWRGRVTQVRKQPCGKCGGRGQFPRGRIFGFFVASRVEYVAGRKSETERAQLVMKRKGVRPLSFRDTRQEPMRRYRHRRPSSFYLVTDPADDEDNRPVHIAAKRLARRKSIDFNQIFIHGRLASFEVPVEIPAVKKRFPGAKLWKLPKDQPKKGVIH